MGDILFTKQHQGLEDWIGLLQMITDISFSISDSRDQEKIEGPWGDDYTVCWDTAGGKEPSRLHPQADCIDHSRG